MLYECKNLNKRGSWYFLSPFSDSWLQDCRNKFFLSFLFTVCHKTLHWTDLDGYLSTFFYENFIVDGIGFVPEYIIQYFWSVCKVVEAPNNCFSHIFIPSPLNCRSRYPSCRTIRFHLCSSNGKGSWFSSWKG